MTAISDMTVFAGVVAAMYNEDYSIPICATLLTYQTLMLFYSNQPGRKVHRSLSCALAVTEMTNGGVMSLLFFVEVIFNFRFYFSNSKVLWNIFLWISISATYSVGTESASLYLALTAYYLVNQLRLEARSIASLQIDPIFKSLVYTFSEIIKFASLFKHALISYYTNDFAPFLFCAGINVLTTNLNATTSFSLVAHAIAANLPWFVIAEWATAMLLAHWIAPLYEFNIVAVYWVDALFFLRIWYF